jgi:uncharacterized membrane protein (GlpM family)
VSEPLRFAIKVAISVCVIAVAGFIARRWPSLAGLIAVMPLTGLLVMLWVYSDTAGNPAVMVQYARGALWGILPTILFFAVTFLCFRKQLSLPITLSAAFAVWLLAATIHQWLLNR